MQIDFGERLVEIGSSKVRAYLFVATLGYSCRHHIRAFRNERKGDWLRQSRGFSQLPSGSQEPIVYDRQIWRRVSKLLADGDTIVVDNVAVALLLLALAPARLGAIPDHNFDIRGDARTVMPVMEASSMAAVLSDGLIQKSRGRWIRD